MIDAVAVAVAGGCCAEEALQVRVVVDERCCEKASGCDLDEEQSGRSWWDGME